MEKRYFRKVNSPRTQHDEVSDKELVFGIRAVEETIRAGKEIERLLLQNDLHNPLILQLQQQAQELNIPIQKVPLEKLNRITRKNHQGVICYISPIQYASLDNVVSSVFESGKMPLILVLDRITDVRNFGAIARTAECAGVHAIVVPSRGSAQISGDAIKTSAGGLNFIPVCREPNLKETLRYLQESGIQVVACSEKTDKLIYDVDFNQPVAILMGSEEDGISPEYLKRSDVHVKIPMVGQISSLNVSVAAGVIIFEAIRQRGLA